MPWNLKGRQALESLDPSTKHRVIHSHAMTQCAHRPLLWVLEELTTVPYVGGLSGPTQKVEYFLCLVSRVLQICPAPEVVLALLRQDIHKYARVAAMLVIRLIGNADMMNEAVAIGLDDYRKVRVFGDEECLPAVVLSANEKSRNGVSLSVGDASASAKRPRSGAAAAEEARTVGDARLEALLNLKPPHYFLWRVDEVTEEIFGLGRSLDTQHRFLGVPLPPLLDKLTVPVGPGE